MALKFSTGSKDSLHPELVKAGLSPETVKAILEGKPLQGFGYPGFRISSRGWNISGKDPNPAATVRYMETQWRRDNAGELAVDTALPKTDPDVGTLTAKPHAVPVESRNEPSPPAPDTVQGADVNAQVESQNWGETAYTFRDRAGLLFCAGLEPIPIVKGDKRPAISEWTTERIDVSKIEEWCNRYGTCGVGIRLGKDELCAIDVDCDNEEIAKEIEEYLEGSAKENGYVLPVRYGRTPRFLIPCRIDGFGEYLGKQTVSSWIDQDGKKHCIEVLTEGQQFVAYGIHPKTGKPYTWKDATPEQLAIGQIPEFTIEEVLERLKNKFDTLCNEHGFRNGKHEPRKERAVTEIQYTQPADIVGLSGHNEQKKKAGIEELQEVLALLPGWYCDNYEEWIKVGAALHHETLGSGAGLALFDKWSKQSDKYKGEEETSDKWKSFHGKGSGDLTIGTLYGILKQDGIQVPNKLKRIQAERLGKYDSSPLLVDTIREYEEEMRKEETRRARGLPDEAEAILDRIRKKISTFDVKSAIATKPAARPFIVSGYLPCGTVSFLSAAGGTGKSYLSTVLAIAIATGQNLGPFEVEKPGPVLMLSVEDDARDIAPRLYRICQEYGLPSDAMGLLNKNLIVVPARGLMPPLMEPGPYGTAPRPGAGTAVLRALMEEYNPNLVILDTKSRLFGLKENSNEDGAAWISNLERLLSDRPGCSFLVLSHTGKKFGAAASGQYSDRGASANTDNARSALVYERLIDEKSGKAKTTPDGRELFVLRHVKSNYSKRREVVYFTQGEGGVPVLCASEVAQGLEAEKQKIQKALDVLVEELRGKPEGINKRNFEAARTEDIKNLLDKIKDASGLNLSHGKNVTNQRAALIDFGVNAGVLEKVEDKTSKAGTKPVVVRLTGLFAGRETEKVCQTRMSVSDRLVCQSKSLTDGTG